MSISLSINVGNRAAGQQADAVVKSVSPGGCGCCMARWVRESAKHLRHVRRVQDYFDQRASSVALGLRRSTEGRAELLFGGDANAPRFRHFGAPFTAGSSSDNSIAHPRRPAEHDRIEYGGLPVAVWVTRITL
jgi:hypothetical protein